MPQKYGITIDFTTLGPRILKGLSISHFFQFIVLDLVGKTTTFDGLKCNLNHMNLHEYQGKELLKSYGVKIQEGIVAHTPEEAEAAAHKLKACLLYTSPSPRDA